MAATSSPINLFHGTNDNHEFWQSEDTALLILRVYKEKAWTSHRNGGYVASHDSAEKGAERLNAVLDTARAYREINGKFHLVSTVPVKKAANQHTS